MGGDAPVAANFVFEVDGVEIGAFKEVSGLELVVTTQEYVEGGQNQYVHRFPGVMRWPNLVFRRGLVNSDALFSWVTKTSGDEFAGNGNALTRATGAVTVVDGTGKRLRSWQLDGVFAVAWSGPRLSAEVAESLVETLEVAHNGFRAAAS
ncbi:phage tail protein [Cellulomonas palmilytica]|nr:phage tail protein [Cellulomonas palmilytica]